MPTAAAVAASSPISQALVPMVSGYLLVMGALGLALRRLIRSGAAPDRPGEHITVPWPGARPRHGWLALAWHAAVTAVGGYLLLMAVVIGYYFGVAHVGGQFLKSAFTGTALLAGVAAPVFAAASWLAERRRTATAGHGSRDRKKSTPAGSASLLTAASHSPEGECPRSSPCRS